MTKSLFGSDRLISGVSLVLSPDSGDKSFQVYRYVFDIELELIPKINVNWFSNEPNIYCLCLAMT